MPVASARAIPNPAIIPIIVVLDNLENATIANLALPIPTAKPKNAFVILKTTIPIPIAFSVSKLSLRNLTALPANITASDNPLPTALATF